MQKRSIQILIFGSDKTNAIRITVPKDSTIPAVPTNLVVGGFYETLMIEFDNISDADLASYEYQVYAESQVT